MLRFCLKGRMIGDLCPLRQLFGELGAHTWSKVCAPGCPPSLTIVLLEELLAGQ